MIFNSVVNVGDSIDTGLLTAGPDVRRKYYSYTLYFGGS